MLLSFPPKNYEQFTINYELIISSLVPINNPLLVFHRSSFYVLESGVLGLMSDVRGLFLVWLGNFEGIFASLFCGVKCLVAPAGNIVRGIVRIILAQTYTD